MRGSQRVSSVIQVVSLAMIQGLGLKAFDFILQGLKEDVGCTRTLRNLVFGVVSLCDFFNSFLKTVRRFGFWDAATTRRV